MIVDLPEDATEIFVGDPKVANAVVRSARRLYVAAVANGQTTIFALAADGRKIAALEVSVGRDVGELQELLNVALPGNDITVQTVGDSIILTGSVASAGDAQKALDIASGFVGTSVLGGASNAAPERRRRRRRVDAGQRRAVGHSADRQGHQFADHPRPRPGQPAGDDHRNPPRHHQAARRQHGRRRLRRSNGFVDSQPVHASTARSPTAATLGWVTAAA